MKGEKSKEKKAREDRKAEELQENEPRKRKQTLIPSKANFDYVNRPESKSSVNAEHSVEPNSSSGILLKILKSKRKK